MHLSPVVLRELGIAARRQSTYSVRLATASIALLGLIGVSFSEAFGVPITQLSRFMFSTLAYGAFIYCLLAGAKATADTMSYEKREGTIGLLFLTDLRGYDIVFGKFVSSSIATISGLLAVLPLMTLVLLMGGVSAGEVVRVTLVLLNTLFFSLAVGIVVSSMSRNERKAFFATFTIILFFAVGPFVVAWLAAAYNVTEKIRIVLAGLMISSPGYSLGTALSPMVGGRQLPAFYLSLGIIHGISWLCLIAAGIILPKVCKDEPKRLGGTRWRAFVDRWKHGDSETRRAYRSELLNKNAFLWLASRERRRTSYVWGLLVGTAVFWIWGYWQYQSILLDWQGSVGILFLVFFCLKIWCSSEVCTRFVEDRRLGAWELLLSTTFSIDDIIYGQKLALWRMFAKPAGMLLIVGVALMFVALEVTFRGGAEKHTIVMSFIALLIVFVADMITLTWVAMRQSLKTNDINKAQSRVLFLVLSLPWLITLSLIAGFNLLQWFSGTQSAEIPGYMMVLCWFWVSLIVDVILVIYSKHHVRETFRIVASQRFTAPASRLSLTSRFWMAIKTAASSRNNGEERNAGLQAAWKRYWWTAAPAVVILFFFIFVVWTRSSASDKVERELARIRIERLPVSLAELPAWRTPVPEPEDARPMISEAMNHLISPISVSPNLPGYANLSFPTPGKPMDDDAKNAVGDLLKKNETLLRLLKKAAQKPKCWFPPRTSVAPIPGLVVPGSSGAMFNLHLRNSVYVLLMEVLWNVEEGNVQAAVDSLGTILDLAKFLGDDPDNNFQHLFHIFISSAAVGLENLLNKHELSNSQMELLLGKVSHLEDNSRLKKRLIASRAFMIDLYERPPSQNWQPGQFSNFAMSLIAAAQSWNRVSGTWKKEEATYLEAMQSLIELSELPYPERRTRMNAIISIMQDTVVYNAGIAGGGRRKVLPEVTMMEWLDADNIGIIETMQIVLKIEQYRHRNNGAIPESLEKLVPDLLEAVPIDPQINQPFKITCDEQGYVVELSAGLGSRKGNKSRRILDGNFQRFYSGRGQIREFRVNR